MSLHIQMSEEAEAELRKSAMRNRLSSLTASLLLIVLGGLILFLTAIYIAKEVPAEFVAYVPTAENAPPTDRPVQQDLTSKAASPSSSVAPSVIVAVGAASPIAMAPVELDMASPDDFGVGSDIAMGFGSGGIGDGLGDGGSGLGEGKAGGSALTGTFYDLKQTARGASTGIRAPGGGDMPEADQAKLHEILHDFMRNWNAGQLNKYYSSDQKLYASNFYLPTCKASYGPKAFQCEDKVKPAGWVAVYRGKVRAPKTGKFRFVGTGDDLLAVRFNNKQVLEAGWCLPSTFEKNTGAIAGKRGAIKYPQGKAYHDRIKEGKDPNHKGYVIAHYNGVPKWNDELGGLTAGEAFNVKEGEVYSVEILISEVPGGAFGFALLLDEYDEETKSWKFPGKQLDIFRTNFSQPDQQELQKLLQGYLEGNLECPPYNEDSLIWVAVP